MFTKCMSDICMGGYTMSEIALTNVEIYINLKSKEILVLCIACLYLRIPYIDGLKTNLTCTRLSITV